VGQNVNAVVIEEARQVVLDDLAQRPPADPSGASHGSRKRLSLRGPDLESVTFIKERQLGRGRVLAVGVDDGLGERWWLLSFVVQDDAGGWRMRGGLASRDEPIVGREEPWLKLGAWRDADHFVGGGRIQGAGPEIARVRLAWPDGSTLEDDAHSGVALFLADRVPTGPARVEFYDSAGVLIASHATLKDERGPIRLPNFASATIPSETLVRFALSADHPLGRHKARRFETELGVTDRDWAALRDQILQALPHATVRSVTYSMPMGCAYEVVIPVAGVNGAMVSVLTIWTVLEGDSTPRLRSASIESP
jgi:hypothetical protein